MITLILPTQGNPVALKRTIDSVKDICDEIIVGDVCVFQDDRELINSYKKEYNLKMVSFDFNYILKNGFSAILNRLADEATNDIVLYLNVGEIFDSSIEDILSVISPEYNAYYIDHETEKHRWFRCYNRHEMRWQGIIHEEIYGDYRPYHKPIFRFADTEKDTDNHFKSKVYNSIKEMCYWSLLIRIADNPDNYPETNDGWKQFAVDTYKSMKDRLEQKGDSYVAMIEGDFNKFINYINISKEFEEERFNSNHAIEFQGDPMYLGKK